MDFRKYNYQGDQNIGFYAVKAAGKLITAREFNTDQEHIETRINGTDLVGLFLAGNSNGVLVPDSTTERELEMLDEAGLNYTVIESNENVFGNLVAANDRGAIISPKLEEFKEKIEEALEVPVKVASIAEIPNPGACIVANNKGVVLHRDASEDDAELVKKVLQVEDVDIGTVNMGSPYVSSGTVIACEEILIGMETTGPEVGRIDRVLN